MRSVPLDPTEAIRSAWLKWARAVEHQKALAGSTREWLAERPYRYERTDNCADRHDPCVRMEWRLRIDKPYPERWSVLVGDAVTNLRAALDHALWAAAVTHSGPPSNPHAVQFPIAPTRDKFVEPARRLSGTVSEAVWRIVEAVQPFHGGPAAHTAPLEVLRWLSNVDKHRAVHIVGRVAVDMGPAIIRSAVPLDVVDEWRLDGPATDGAVIARLIVRRPASSEEIEIVPSFGHLSTIQIADGPEPELRSLASAMDVTQQRTFEVLVGISESIGARPPTDLHLGEEHDSIHPEHGGDVLHFTDFDGRTHVRPLRADPGD
jgi:hypothetical protein